VNNPESEAEREQLRREILAEHGAAGPVIEELLETNRCRVDADPAMPTFPLEDEPHLQAWSGYADHAEEIGVWRALRQKLPQLQFPIRSGISGEEQYRGATLRGQFPASDESGKLELDSPESLELALHASIAGTVPILTTEDREDFVALARALSARNEPIEIPPSMGACLVSGFNNWDRIRSYRAEWEAEDPSHRTPGAWSAEFRRLLRHKQRYQDRFIILSRGSYSGVSARDLDLEEEEWLDRSYLIRREHECTHYFSVRVFGLLQHNVLEELVADFVGTLLGLGRFRADAGLRFLGLEDFPRYRAGGRLENYRGDPPISDPAFEVMSSLAHRAVHNLESIANTHPDLQSDAEQLAGLVFALTKMTLEELAAEDALSRPFLNSKK
jgi:hypothetical protein